MEQMNLKKTYVPSNGLTMLCKEGECSLKELEYGILELAPGQSHDFSSGDKEAAFIILGGRCSVKGEGIDWTGLGARRSVFENTHATAFYIGRNTSIRISADWNVKIAVCLAPAAKDNKPFVVTPDDVKVITLGKKPWERETSFIFDMNMPTEHFCIGEAYITPGNWAGYPPHKHDTDNMPAEGVLEELYYYMFQPEQGFGLQYVYTKDGEIDAAYPVKNNELVEFPKGYHATVGAPGYNFYFLWVMSGDNKGFYRSNDPDHEWVAAVENLLKKL